MKTAEALDLAERALRRGMCSPTKIAHDGCATCEAARAAIAELRRSVGVASIEVPWEQGTLVAVRFDAAKLVVSFYDASGPRQSERAYVSVSADVDELCLAVENRTPLPWSAS